MAAMAGRANAKGARIAPRAPFSLWPIYPKRVTPWAPGRICDRLKAFMNSSSETHPFSWTMTFFINARIAGPP